MTPNLIKTPIVDKNGKQTTVRKRADTGTVSKQLGNIAPTVAKPATRKRRAYKPTESQLENVSFMVPRSTADDRSWGKKVNRETDPELNSIPIATDGRYSSDDHCYRFSASEVEYFDVMSVVRPWDAINLLARGIKTSDEAREFLAENNLEDLIHDKPEIAEELMRGRINVNLAASYMDEIIDADADPKNGLEWVKTCAMKTIMYKAEAIKDEMLSGNVTYADLSRVGVRNLDPGIKEIAEYIVHSRNDNNPDFTVEDIATVTATSLSYGSMQTIDAKKDSLRIRLNLARFYGVNAATGYSAAPPEATVWLRNNMLAEGTVNDRELADLTRFCAKLKHAYYKGDNYHHELVEIFRSGTPAEKVSDMLADSRNSAEAVLRLAAANNDIPLSLADGWV